MSGISFVSKSSCTGSTAERINVFTFAWTADGSGEVDMELGELAGLGLYGRFNGLLAGVKFTGVGSEANLALVDPEMGLDLLNAELTPVGAGEPTAWPSPYIPLGCRLSLVMDSLTPASSGTVSLIITD